MIKLIKKVALFLVAVLLLGCMGVGFLIKFYPERYLGITYEYKIWKYQQSRITNIYPGKINAIIGDSRGSASLNPVYIGDKYVNFSLPGSTFFEGFISLQRLLQENHVDTVVMCYSAYHFETDECLYERTISFSFIDYKQLKWLFKNERSFNENIEVEKGIIPSYYQQLTFALRLMHFPLSYRSTIVDDIFNNNREADGKFIDRIYGTRGHILFNESGGINTAKTAEAGKSNSEFYLNLVIMAYMDSINDLASRNGIKCFLVLPTESASNNAILQNSRYYTEFNTFLSSFKSRYPHILIIKNLNSLPDSCYTDGTHTNEKGCKILSENLANILANKDTATGLNAALNSGK